MKNIFQFFPGENEPKNSDEPKSNEEQSEISSDETSSEPGFFDKVKKALQEWSNDDAKDVEYDDSHV